MKIVLIIVVAIVVLIAIVYLVGMMLPVKHIAVVSDTFKSRPEDVWNVVNNVSDWKRWKKNTKDITLTGPDTFREKDSHGEVDYRISNAVPGKSFQTTIITENLPYGGGWTFVFEPVSEGTKLTITENGEVYNPIFRFMSRFIFGHYGNLKSYISDLKATVN